MIEGYGLKLSPPVIEHMYKSQILNEEVISLIHTIQQFFNQKNIIYDAELTVSNNEYEQLQTDYGSYKKRIDITFNLRYLKEIRIYVDYILFKTVDEEYKVKTGKDFFYFLEWENSYYE